MKQHIELPKRLLINSPKVKAAGHEETGEIIMNYVRERLGLDSYADTDILDVGCGSRFTLSIINRKINIKSYTGIEINKNIVDFFQQEVEAEDERFHYHHWNVQNDMYNAEGKPMSEFDDLPAPGDYDLIWLFSVFTHLNADDSLSLLKLMRKKIRPSGNLFFTTHTNSNVKDFEDKIEEKPLLRAFYNPDYLASLVVEAGWKVDGFYDKDGSKFVKSHFVCSPD